MSNIQPRYKTMPEHYLLCFNDEGELPVGYNQETLFARHSSKPRNRNIANAFFKAGIIDTWGRGFQKICDGFEPTGISMPKVENFCGGVRVTIQRAKFMQMMNVTSDVSSSVCSSSNNLARPCRPAKEGCIDSRGQHQRRSLDLD